MQKNVKEKTSQFYMCVPFLEDTIIKATVIFIVVVVVFEADA